MYIICGLGNPGNKYKYTRHNVGFLFLELLSESYGFTFKKEKGFSALCTKTKYLGEECIFIKPQTYMNLSGDSILAAASFYKIEKDKIIIVHDDVDLPFNSLKIKSSGGTAGHKGLKSIVSKIGNDFHRIRIGVGKPLPPMDTADYVLQNFSSEEIKKLPKILEFTQDALDSILTNGIDKAMNEFNKKNE